mmetsp:Transcript_6866/g.24427  ORF Transcript_6866/g.24427 Transcript_6866/m.24427 type:complete len:204 (+) Transcript_6866:116-727(+)
MGRSPHSPGGSMPIADIAARNLRSLANGSSTSSSGRLRAMTRGASVASTSDSPWMMRFTRTLVTVPMILLPPGDPSAMNGTLVPFTLRSTSVGDIDERGRLPPSVAASAPTAVRRAILPPCTRLGLAEPSGKSGIASKSVSSLLSRKPRPGTTTAAPRFSSMVVVHDTTLPCTSAIEKCVVPLFLDVSGAALSSARRRAAPSG